jgi:hypothetical protein
MRRILLPEVKSITLKLCLSILTKREQTALVITSFNLILSFWLQLTPNFFTQVPLQIECPGNALRNQRAQSELMITVKWVLYILNSFNKWKNSRTSWSNNLKMLINLLDLLRKTQINNLISKIRQRKTT